MSNRDSVLSSLASNMARSSDQRSTFLTAVNSMGGNSQLHSVLTDNIRQYYEKLTGKVTKLDSMIDTVLSKHEKEFMAAFKVHMHQVYSQLADLKKRTDEQEQQLKTDAQVTKLQSSMDWFRDEAMKLKDQVTKLAKDVDKWKSKAITLDDDRRFLETQLKSTRRENKLLKIALSKIRDFDSPNTVPPTAPPSAPALTKPPCTAPNINQSDWFNSLSDYSTSNFVTYLKSKYHVRNPNLLIEVDTYLQGQEKKFQASLKHYQNTITVERRRSRTISANRSHKIQEKNDLEALFLQWVDEIKKDMIKRRSKSSQSKRIHTARENSSFISSDKRKILELFVSNEQVLVMLYEMLFPHKASKLKEIMPRRFEPHPPSIPKPESSRSDLSELLDPATDISNL